MLWGEHSFWKSEYAILPSVYISIILLIFMILVRNIEIFLRAVRFIFFNSSSFGWGGWGDGGMGGWGDGGWGDGGMAGWEVHSSSDTDSHRWLLLIWRQMIVYAPGGFYEIVKDIRIG